MNETEIPYWGRQIIRRLEKLEDLDPAVVAERVRELGNDVKALRRAFYTFAFSVATSAIVFAITAFTVFGKA